MATPAKMAAALALLSVLSLLCAAARPAAAQPVRANPSPKAGELCKDLGPDWAGVPLGPCSEPGTTCAWFKRGVHKCTRAPFLVAGDVCFDAGATRAEKYAFRAVGCGQGTACQPAAAWWRGGGRAEKGKPADGSGVHRCAPLPNTGCFDLAGSMYWPGGTAQRYQAQTGMPCGGAYPKCECA